MVSKDVIKEDKLNYMLVEGPDDAQVFFHLLRYYGLDTQVIIQPKEGIDNLLETLEVEFKRRAETRLGIIVDADNVISMLLHLMPNNSSAGFASYSILR